jgi:hypothetical protein
MKKFQQVYQKKSYLPFRMKKTEGWDPTVFVTWSLVAFSLCITVWQGWNCTMRYLSNPVTVEDSFESLSSLPPIQLSICTKFVVGEPLVEELVSDTNYFEVFGGNLVETLPPGTIFTFANSSEEFWQDMDSRREHYRPGLKHSNMVFIVF